jgi:hypothetical protein
LGSRTTGAAVCTGHDYTQPGKPDIDRYDQAAKDAPVSALVNDANALVAALAGAKLDEPAQQAVALLAWWPGRTWNRPRIPMARTPMALTGDGASPVKSPRTGSSPPWTPTRGTPVLKTDVNHQIGTTPGPCAQPEYRHRVT